MVALVAQTSSVVVVTVAASASMLVVDLEASLAAYASDLPMLAVVLMRLPSSLLAAVVPSPAPASMVVELQHASASEVELELLPFVLSLDAAIAVESQRIGCCYLPILLGQGHFPMETFARARAVPRCATRLGRKLVAVPRDKDAAAVLAVPRCPTRLQVWLLQVWLLLLLLLLLQVWLQLVAAAGANLLVPILHRSQDLY